MVGWCCRYRCCLLYWVVCEASQVAEAERGSVEETGRRGCCARIGEGKEFTYTFRSWSDYNYGPSYKDFDYSEEECKKMKKELIKEINATYKQYYEDFVKTYKAFLADIEK